MLFKCQGLFISTVPSIALFRWNMKQADLRPLAGRAKKLFFIFFPLCWRHFVKSRDAALASKLLLHWNANVSFLVSWNPQLTPETSGVTALAREGNLQAGFCLIALKHGEQIWFAWKTSKNLKNTRKALMQKSTRTLNPVEEREPFLRAFLNWLDYHKLCASFNS